MFTTKQQEKHRIRYIVRLLFYSFDAYMALSYFNCGYMININTDTGDVQYSILKEIEELIESLMVAYCIILFKSFLKATHLKKILEILTSKTPAIGIIFFSWVSQPEIVYYVIRHRFLCFLLLPAVDVSE